MPDASSRTFAEERRRAIMGMLEHNASVQVKELVRTFGVSAVTVRGDLDALERDGKLRRTHGGAVSLHRALTVSVQDRRVNVNVGAKQAIARAALGLVESGDTVLVDSGTTALEFVRMLDMRTGVTVITADITIANYIDESMPTVNCMLLGGSLRKGHRYLYGPLTLHALGMLHADVAVVCPGAFLPSCGFMTDYPQMAEVKAALINSADRAVALLDASKVGRGGIMRFAGLADVDAVVVNGDPGGTVAEAIAEVDGTTRPQLMLA